MIDNFYGKYVIAQAISTNAGGELLSADNVIGDVYDIRCEIENGEYKAYTQNRFGKSPCCFNSDVSRETYLLKNKGYRLFAILTLVGFTYSDNQKESNYWGEFAIICFNKVDSEIFLPFIDAFTKEIDKGNRPTLDLSKENYKQIKEGDYSVLSNRVSLPKKNKGTVFMKTHRKISEKLIELGREKNFGCYIVSICFLFVLVFVIILLLKVVIGF